MGMDIDENAKPQETTMGEIGTRTTKSAPLKINSLVKSVLDFIQTNVGSMGGSGGYCCGGGDGN